MSGKVSYWDEDVREVRDVPGVLLIREGEDVQRCIRCEQPVDKVDQRNEFVVSNPESVFMGISNPAPNPALDRHILLYAEITMRPCGHQFRAYPDRSVASE